MGDKEQLKILDEKFLERKHLLSAIIERFLDNESYYGLSFTSLMENASSSIAAFGVNYRVQGQGNEQYLQSSDFQDLLLLVKQLIENGEVQVLPPEVYYRINRAGFP